VRFFAEPSQDAKKVPNRTLTVTLTVPLTKHRIFRGEISSFKGLMTTKKPTWAGPLLGDLKSIHRNNTVAFLG